MHRNLFNNFESLEKEFQCARDFWTCKVGPRTVRRPKGKCDNGNRKEEEKKGFEGGPIHSQGGVLPIKCYDDRTPANTDGAHRRRGPSCKADEWC